MRAMFAVSIAMSAPATPIAIPPSPEQGKEYCYSFSDHCNASFSVFKHFFALILPAGLRFSLNSSRPSYIEIAQAANSLSPISAAILIPCYEAQKQPAWRSA